MIETTHIEFQAGGNVQKCFNVEIIDDLISEGRERFEIELRSSDSNVIIAEPARVAIEIEDNDEGEISQQQSI